jgi:hypothetical protein
MQRNILISSLFLALLSNGWVSTEPVRAIPTQSIIQAQANTAYDDYMRQGYRATAKRQYSSARDFFKNALRLRPNDRYADRAVINVSRYIDQRGYVTPKLLAGRGVSAPGGSAFATARSGPTATSHNVNGCKDCLMGLMPAKEDQKGAKLLTTVADYPSLIFYAKPTSKTVFEFSIAGKTYKLNPNIPTTGGFISINFASLKDDQGNRFPPLVVGQTYDWRLMLRESVDTSGDNPTVSGTLTRKAVDPALASTLKQALPADQISLYANDDLWYDMVAALYDARRQDPQNPALQAQWVEVLANIQLGKIAQLPLN